MPSEARKNSNLPFLLFTVFLLASTTLFAQLQSGRIVGSVYDPQQASIPGATVTVTNIGTNFSRTVMSDAQGNFVVTPLDPGNYRVSATATGFQTSVVPGVELVVGQSLRVPFTLSIGATTAEVEVTAQAPLLNTETATLGQVVENQQIVDLPLNGRSFHELGRLVPGSVLLPSTGNTQSVRPEKVNGNVINGISGWQTRFLLDGVDITEEHQGGTWIQTSVDALQEFSVQQNAYSSEFQGAGGSFNATTKSGTNSLHGTLFEFLRNEKLDARNYFAQTREPLKRNQFGGTLGGPVVIPGLYNGHNRTFFMVSYEGIRQHQGNVSNNIVPTEAQRNGDFQGERPVYDPLTTRPNPSGPGVIRDQFPNNMIPTNRLSPQAQYMNRFIPLPNTPEGTFVANPLTVYDMNQVTLRLDQEISANHRAFGRFSRHYNTETTDAAFPALGSSTIKGPAINIVAALNSNLGNTVVHEFRFSRMYGQYRSNAYFQGEGTRLLQEAGITGIVLQDPTISSLPAFTISGYEGFSGNVSDGRPKWQNRSVYEVIDNLTWMKGRHILKFGGRMYRRHILFTDSRTHNGTFAFNGVMTQNPITASSTGDAFADWMLGYPANSSRSNPATWWGGFGTYWHTFVQDDIKVNNSLTVNVGLRYEFTPWLTGYRNQAAAFDPTQARSIIVSSETDQIDLDAQPGAAAGYELFKDLIQTSSQAGLPIQITENDKTQFAPRLGFAWRPLGESTVIRGGYGIFYTPEGTSGRLNFNFLPYRLSETVAATPNVVPTRTFANFYQGVPFGQSLGSVTWLPLPLESKMAYVQRYSFGIQHQLTNAMVFELNYVGNRALHQQQSETINTPPAGQGSVQSRRPYPRFGAMSVFTNNQSSNYNSFQAKLQRRNSGGLWYLVSYTFSKTLSRQPAPQIGGDYTYDYGLAEFDIPHVLAVSAGYALPFGRGKAFLGGSSGFLDAIVGGWQMQGIVNFRSGTPFTPTISTDTANIGVNNQRPNRLGSGELENPTLAQWFDKSAFAVPAQYAFGNSGRGILRSDYQGIVNLSLFKQFAITEGARLQFRAEAFNFPNTAYFSAPNTQVNTTAGGRVTSTSNDARQIQIALKLIF